MTACLSALSASPLTSLGLVGQVESNAGAAGLPAARQAGLITVLKSALRDAV